MGYKMTEYYDKNIELQTFCRLFRTTQHLLDKEKNSTEYEMTASIACIGMMADIVHEKIFKGKTQKQKQKEREEIKLDISGDARTLTNLRDALAHPTKQAVDNENRKIISMKFKTEKGICVKICESDILSIANGLLKIWENRFDIPREYRCIFDDIPND